MATVTGTLTDFALTSLNGFLPEIHFIPTGPAVQSGKFYATKTVKVVPAVDGAFSVTLVETTGLVPKVWYKVQVRWLDSGSNYVLYDVLPKLEVPAGGGTISDLIGAVTTNDLVYISDTSPDAGVYAGFQLNPLTGDLFKRVD